MDVVEEPRSEGGRLAARQSAAVPWCASAAMQRLAAVAVPRPPAGAVRVRVRVPGGAPACAGQPRRSRRHDRPHVTDLRDLVKRQFGLNAERYVLSYDHSKGESLDRMLELVLAKPDWRVLDISTGGGHISLAFAPRVREVIATDITQEMLDAAERFVRGKGVRNITFAEADACDLPFGAAEFDLVTCRVAPHHFPDCARFTREMTRVLKPGGYVAMIDTVVPEDRAADEYINAFEKFRDPSHVRSFTANEWLKFFSDARLEIETAEVFRKARDFEAWAGLQTVSGERKAELRRKLEHAPPGVAEALGPETREGALFFYLPEILILARR